MSIRTSLFAVMDAIRHDGLDREPAIRINSYTSDGVTSLHLQNTTSTPSRRVVVAAGRKRWSNGAKQWFELYEVATFTRATDNVPAALSGYTFEGDVVAHVRQFLLEGTEPERRERMNLADIHLDPANHGPEWAQ